MWSLKFWYLSWKASIVSLTCQKTSRLSCSSSNLENMMWGKLIRSILKIGLKSMCIMAGKYHFQIMKSYAATISFTYLAKKWPHQCEQSYYPSQWHKGEGIAGASLAATQSAASWGDQMSRNILLLSFFDTYTKEASLGWLQQYRWTLNQRDTDNNDVQCDSNSCSTANSTCTELNMVETIAKMNRIGP